MSLAALQRVLAQRWRSDGSGGVEARRWRRCGWRWCDSGAWADQEAQRRGVWRRCSSWWRGGGAWVGLVDAEMRRRHCRSLRWRGGGAQAGQVAQRRGVGGAVARGGAAALP